MLDPAAAEFAAIRADLGRLYLAHKAELGMAEFTDDYVIEHIDDITAMMIGLGQAALQNDARAWLERHAWFTDATTRLFADQPATTLDG